ncbi:MAG: hypothetical protein Q9227_001615 [Pyrenula ochraceoflavens]
MSPRANKDRSREHRSKDITGAPEDAEQSKESASTNAKRVAIQEACEANDIDKLIDLASSPAGFLDDSLRKKAWPILLGCTSHELESNIPSSVWLDKPRHRDEDQVQLDVRRAFIYYPSGRNEKDIEEYKQRLSDLITNTLRTYPMLCYFQGYHDIVQVLLLVLGDKLAPPTVARLSLLRIRDFMLPSLSPALKHLQLLPCILERIDATLCRHISGTRPFFALPATLTLYAHNIQEYSNIARVYDFLLSQEPVMAIYLFAAIVLSRREELLDIPADEPDVLQVTLQKLPQPLDLERLVADTTVLHSRHPPETLPSRSWQRVSSLSVLKTSRDLHRKQSMEEAQAIFHRQEQRLRLEELQEKALTAAWKYRRPVGSAAAALVVGILSIWLRRTGNDRILWFYVRRISDSWLHTRP